MVVNQRFLVLSSFKQESDIDTHDNLKKNSIHDIVDERVRLSNLGVGHTWDIMVKWASSKGNKSHTYRHNADSNPQPGGLPTQPSNYYAIGMP